MEEKLAHYFATYKKSNECFVTSDEQLFHKKTDAIAHGKSLKKSNVESITREEFENLLEFKNGSSEAEAKARAEEEAAAAKLAAEEAEAKAKAEEEEAAAKLAAEEAEAKAKAEAEHKASNEKGSSKSKTK